MGNLPSGERCNRRLFDIRIDYSTPMRPHSIETVCPKCGAVNVITIENNRIRVELQKGDYKQMETERIEFIASFPDIQSAINIGGQDRNSRIKLDIPASELAAIVNLLALPENKAFKVIIEELPEKEVW